MKHIVCHSGGHSSALTAIEVVRRFGKENVILVNHDVLLEDADVKRFKQEVADFLELPITYANMQGSDTMNQFDVVIKAEAFKVGDGQILCTNRMKTEPFMRYLKENHAEKDCVVYYGFDATGHEMLRVQRRSSIMGSMGYKTDYPIALWQERTIKDVREVGIEPPLLYSKFKHANCIGCLKAGKQHWYIVYCEYPQIWQEAKRAEEQIGYSLFKDTYLVDLEPKFEAMKQANVPATEHIQSQTFWKNARQAMKESLFTLPVIDAEQLPCECTT